MLEGNDAQLVSNYLKGDEKSLEVLIQRYLKPIYSFIYRYIGNAQEAEDITQEVFVKVWRNLRKFNPQKNLAPYRTNKVSSGSGFKTWIFSIAKNTSIDFLRKKKTIPFSKFSARGGSAFGGENDFAETLIDPAPLPDKLFERTSLKEIINTVINQLAPKYRLVLFLRYNDHFTFREIAESLGEPLNTIKSRHRRALIILKKLLAGEN